MQFLARFVPEHPHPRTFGAKITRVGAAPLHFCASRRTFGAVRLLHALVSGVRFLWCEYVRGHACVQVQELDRAAMRGQRRRPSLRYVRCVCMCGERAVLIPRGRWSE